MHYYKFNISDWALHTAHLNLYEEAIYFRLINFYYDTEKPIPLELEKLSRRLRIEYSTGDLDTVIEEFFEQTESGYTHKRCEEVLKEYRKTNKKNKANGAKGGRPAKSKGSEITQEEPSGLINKPKHNPNYELVTNNQELVTTLKDMFDTLFESYWLAGMKKVNKKKAKSLFISIVKKQDDPSMFTHNLIQDVSKRLSSNQMGFAEMHPTTYLNGERWTDEIREASNGQYQQPNQQISTVERSLRETAAHAEQSRKEIEDIEAQINNGQALGFINH